MVSQNQSEPVRTAKDIAEALGRSPTEKGVGKLAAALAQPQDHALEQPMRVALLDLQSSLSAGEVKIECKLNPRGLFEWWVLVWFGEMACCGKCGDTLNEAINRTLVEVPALRRKAEAIARMERELKEADAAEKALAATAPLEFVPDGSGVDVLPVHLVECNPQPGVVELAHTCHVENREPTAEESAAVRAMASPFNEADFLRDQKRIQEQLDDERIDEAAAAKEDRERFDGVLPADTDGGAA